MKIGDKKMGKKEMKNIQAGTEKNAEANGSISPGNNPRSKCAFTAASCCKRTHDCPTNSDE